MEKVEILHIEDNFADITLTKKILKDLETEFAYHHVSNGKAGLQYLNKEEKYSDAKTPDIVFLDLNLPTIDGFTVLETIKNDSMLKVIPVIIMSTSQHTADVKRSYKLQANAFITKGIDYYRFSNAIKQLDKFWFRSCLLPAKSDPLQYQKEDTEN